jgi:copper chaperone NosL
MEYVSNILNMSGEESKVLSRSERTSSVQSTLRSISRLLIVIAALALSLTYYLPLWTISLDAPQYPEGLGIEIWINQMQGQNPNDLDKINNLNHYIGMKKIIPETIPELKIMPWVMRGVLLLGLAVGVFGKRKLLMLWLIVFMLVAIAGFVDFYLWGYDYGHNLDMEHAIIKVPGMSYQPPLIGSKKLLNFTATSLPGSGGWVAIGTFLTGLALWILEIRRSRKVTVHE